MARAVNNVSVELSVVLGRSNMPINQLLKMGRGAVIELDTTVNDPALILANDRVIARGEVMIVDDHVAITITDTVGINDSYGAHRGTLSYVKDAKFRASAYQLQKLRPQFVVTRQRR